MIQLLHYSQLYCQICEMLSVGPFVPREVFWFIETHPPVSCSARARVLCSWNSGEFETDFLWPWNLKSSLFLLGFLENGVPVFPCFACYFWEIWGQSNSLCKYFLGLEALRIFFLSLKSNNFPSYLRIDYLWSIFLYTPLGPCSL